MDHMSISGIAVPYQAQTAYTPLSSSEAAEQPVLPQEMEDLHTQLSQMEEDSKSLAEMMKEAQEQAEEQRKQLEKFYKANRPNYTSAPMEAYSRLARAKSRSQVNSASGYARQRIAQLKQALREGGDDASAIRASISQLQKAITRAEKKKRDLDREDALARKAKRAREQQSSQEQRLRLEIKRRKSQRMIRESGYIREAEIDRRFQAYATQTQLELRQQIQAIAGAQPSVSPETAALSYTATAQAASPAPVADIATPM